MTTFMKLTTDGKVVPMTEAEIAALPKGVPQVPFPKEIPMVWFKMALSEMGCLDKVNAAMAALGKSKELLWEYDTTAKDDDPDFLAVSKALKIDLVAVFAKAESLMTAPRSTPAA
jgi:hypothetical protein